MVKAKKLYLGGGKILIIERKRGYLLVTEREGKKVNCKWQIPVKKDERAPTKSQILRILGYSKW